MVRGLQTIPAPFTKEGVAVVHSNLCALCGLFLPSSFINKDRCEKGSLWFPDISAILIILKMISLSLFFFKDFIYLRERDRDSSREHKQRGEGKPPSAGSMTQSLIPRP